MKYAPNTCCDCDVKLGEDRVFGMCRSCAEARHASRQARKMLRLVLRTNPSDLRVGERYRVRSAPLK